MKVLLNFRMITGQFSEINKVNHMVRLGSGYIYLA
jgi:hypothetical protein